MFDYDAVIVGGGPAGLAAGLYLSRAKRRAVLIERDLFGGNLKNIEWVENYPGYAEGVSGAQLASEMVKQATRYGLQIEQGEVTGIEFFSSCRWVGCADGQGFTTAVVIIAAGARPRKLGVPGEDTLAGKGVFSCALCDGGHFLDRTVVVCGSGDSAVTEALYLTNLAAKVVLLARGPALKATAVLQERARTNPKLEIRCGSRVEAILGDGRVESIECFETESGLVCTLPADGVLVRVGVEPNTSYLDSVVAVDEGGQILVDARMETETPFILAAGDIRSGSPRQIVTAASDGAVAAIRAEALLHELA